MDKYNAKEDAKAHWKWVKQLLKTQGIDSKALSLAGYLYVTAFVHGAKHQEQSVIEMPL